MQEIYNRFDESKRLTSSNAAKVEFITNVRYIERYLKPGSTILDIGAGTGAYSIYFSRRDYEVTALEPAHRNLNAFRAALAPDDTLTLLEGNGLDLSRFPDESFDAVLVLGPLYHLHSREDQLKCIQQA